MSEVDWDRYNLPAIWSLISDVDVCTGSDRVLAWDGLASAMRDQHRRLLSAADRLAEVWPPAKNDSASFFLQQVNGLADSMQETLSKAEDTKVGLQGVLDAFSAAQEKVRGLASGRQGVSDDWMPRFVDHAEDKYDEHAQAAMREAEAAIQDHASQIQAPALFFMDPSIEGDGHHLTDEDGKVASGSSVGPGRTGLRAIPTAVPVHSDPAGVFPDSPADFSQSWPRAGSSPSDSVGSPVLSGVSPHPPIAPPGSFTSPPAPLPDHGRGLLPNDPLGGGARSPGVLPIRGGFVDNFPGSEGDSGSRWPGSVRRALPSGAVIGEGGEQRSGGRPAGFGGPVPIGGGAGSRGGDRRNSQRAASGRTDQQWRTQQGVAPVIEPSKTKVRHDPGPGVIGFDR